MLPTFNTNAILSNNAKLDCTKETKVIVKQAVFSAIMTTISHTPCNNYIFNQHIKPNIK